MEGPKLLMCTMPDSTKHAIGRESPWSCLPSKKATVSSPGKGELIFRLSGGNQVEPCNYICNLRPHGRYNKVVIEVGCQSWLDDIICK